MKSLKVVLGIAITAVGVSSVAVVGAVNNKTSLVHANEPEVPFEFDVDNVTTRRIYYVNNNNNGHWYKGTALYVYAWNASANSGLVQSHLLYEDYSDWGGIWYADVSFTGCGGQFSIKFSSQSDWNGGQTGELHNVPALSSKNADVIYVNNGSPSYGSAGMSASQLKSVLDQIHTCTKSYANGFYAYPQLNANFFSVSQGAINGDGQTTLIDDVDVEGNDGYTVANKVKELKDQFDARGWYVNAD